MGFFSSVNNTSNNVDPDVGPDQVQITKDRVDILRQLNLIPCSLLQSEIDGVYGANLLKELGELIGLYNVYDRGASFILDSTKDYMPSALRYKKATTLINKEARFMFSITPDIMVAPVVSSKDEAADDNAKEISTVYQNLLDKVFKANMFKKQLLQAAKDCFIGRRVAYMVNFNEDTGIKVSFMPSLEFVFETAQDDINHLTKLVGFFTEVDAADKSAQRIYKKKYEMQKDGFCHVTEGLYDGAGNLVEDIIEDDKTDFKRIPGGVITNDGLTGDTRGVSDIETLSDYESQFSRIANSDIDAIRKGMNPVRWVRDMTPESTTNLSIAAGSLWDLQSEADGEKTGECGILESNMGYSSALTGTLDRINQTMYDQIDMPDTSASALKGVVSSGKTLKALYWPLTTRCDEKMLSWGPAIEDIANIIIEGAILYPNIAKKYITEKLAPLNFDIEVENNYALPEDTQEEKTMDLSEVTAQTMSKKSYMKKWRGLTDSEADLELDQIVLELQLLQDGAINPPMGDTTSGAYDDVPEDTSSDDLGSSSTPEDNVTGGTTEDTTNG